MVPLLILKEIVWPTFTLTSVAKPWRLGLPASPLGVSQTVGSVPGSWFSQGIGLTAQSTARTGTGRRAFPGRSSAATSRPIARMLGKRLPARRMTANVLISSAVLLSLGAGRRADNRPLPLSPPRIHGRATGPKSEWALTFHLPRYLGRRLGDLSRPEPP